MFKRLPGIGLDIGSQKIKLIWVERKKSGLQLIGFGSIDTPAGTLEGGCIIDPERLGTAIRPLVEDLKLVRKSVVSAVGGQQIYMRSLHMPSMKAAELEAAVHYQALNFLPISLKDAAIDIFRVQEFEDKAGKQLELFFLAVSKAQVENLKITCRAAGLKLAVVEIEPLGLCRIIGAEEAQVFGLLSLGWLRSYFTVFKRGVPCLYRTISIGSGAFGRSLALPGDDQPAAIQIPPFAAGDQDDYRLSQIVTEVRAAIEYHGSQTLIANQAIEKIWLCGARAISGLDMYLARELGVELEAIDILNQLGLPRNAHQMAKRELQTDFAVALGLAARGQSY